MQAERPAVRGVFLLRVSFIAGLGGILYGFDVGIIAAALLFVRNTFALSTHMQEIVVSVVPAGTMAGAIVGGILSDRLGRRATLLWSGAIFIVGSILAPLAPTIGFLIIARSLLGFAIGFTSVTAPVYVSELSPPQTRGTLIGLYQFALTFGIVFANLIGYWFASEESWRLMFAIGIVPAAVFLALVFTVPESPRWLYIKNRSSEAEQVLLSYTDAHGARLLLDDIHKATIGAGDETWRALLSPAARRGLLIAVGFVVLQQLCGINTVIYYGPQIFALAGIDSNQHAILATLLVSVMNMLATVIALFLVDRIGRKPLLYWGVGGMLVSLFLLAFTFGRHSRVTQATGLTAVICLMGYITCFAASMGPIAWILVGEVFPLRLRSRGAAAATIGYGISNTLVSLSFLTVSHRLGNALTFGVLGFFCVATLLFTLFIIPETKGRELESIST
ncbi:MAG TPA: sugar porter family MFS transporter [Edaphobacter sp.]|nr:sugar porter family MFS transporter [Edaphobacter sp.]